MSGDDHREWAGFLGYEWESSSDELRMAPFPPALEVSPQPTIRELLSVVPQFYDILGVNLKHQMLGRQLIQRAFHEKLNNCNAKEMWNSEII